VARRDRGRERAAAELLTVAATSIVGGGPRVRQEGTVHLQRRRRRMALEEAVGPAKERVELRPIVEDQVGCVKKMESQPQVCYSCTDSTSATPHR
jgi:hypothetical protein